MAAEKPVHSAADNVLPDAKMLTAAGALPALDREKNSHAFRDIYQGPNSSQNVMIFFTRHFFCPSCQAYASQVAKSITPEVLTTLSTSTSLILIGCGAPELIDFYAQVTGWPYAIYTDPTYRLHDALGFNRQMLQISTPGTYIQKSVPSQFIQSVGQMFSQIAKNYRFHYGGDGRINGGEMFLQPGRVGEEAEKQVTWCNRMKGGGDHAELPELRDVLGLPAPELPEGVDPEVWAKVLTERKGARLGEISTTDCGC